MNLRKLDQEERGRTRALWEEVFSGDSKAFLDYYYYIKTRDNEILAVEKDGEICSMLHMNPYMVRIEAEEYPSVYIVAVATRQPYRSRGYMGALIRASLEEMYNMKMPFTFLMPAAEAIYRPYDFRYIYKQNSGKLVLKEKEGPALWSVQEKEPSSGAGENRREEKTAFSDAGLWDADEMAEFFQTYFAERWQICTVRDRAYYQTLILEQQSEKGGVRLIRENGVLKGFYAYSQEEATVIREPLYLKEYDAEFRRSVYEIVSRQGKNGSEEIKVLACPEEYASGQKPLIMARIVCLPELLGALKVPYDVEMDCSFAVIDPVLTKNSRVWRIRSGLGETKIHVRESEDSEGVFPVAELTELLFGYASVPEIRSRTGVILSEHLSEEIEKITKLSCAYFNEVV